jgi:hypothetical protein
MSESRDLGVTRTRLRPLWSWLKGHAAATGIFLAGGALGVGVLLFSAVISSNDIQEAADPQTVACDWARTISALHIYPVYPPSEDFHVGDLIAIRELGNVNPCDKGSSTSVLFRTMHMAHVPGAETALQKHYGKLLQLPVTPDKYDGTSPVIADNDLFTAATTFKSVPIVAFPGITVATASTTTGSAGFLSDVRNLFAGSERTRSNKVQLKIPEAATYGLDADEALSLIDQYCTDNFVCTKDGVRQALSSKTEDEFVNLYFIIRIYVTRAIDYQYGSDTAVAAAVKVKLKDEASGSKSASPPAPNSQQQTQTQSTAQSLETTRTRVIQDLGYLAQGGQLTTAGVTSAGVVLRTQFARPVVIGYSAIRFNRFPDLPQAHAESAHSPQ